ncbi:hypothetical protein Mal48_38820 [Thalassoglobus polymorphus]|uniref:Uncharacterized protein n=1 Tax=Thalassoglobus polymorphus TaxID=2527994 RepID=A0A517QSL9_9PLAN|nr:hypothetical protein Mal48_38820 [Thalassoglobus polymorphus]
MCSSSDRSRRLSGGSCVLLRESLFGGAVRLLKHQCPAVRKVYVISASPVRSLIRHGLCIANVCESLTLARLVYVSLRWNICNARRSFIIQVRFQALTVRAYIFRVDKFRKGAGLASLNLRTLDRSRSAHLNAAHFLFCVDVADSRKCFSSRGLSLIQPADSMLLSEQHVLADCIKSFDSDFRSGQEQAGTTQFTLAFVNSSPGDVGNSQFKPYLSRPNPVRQFVSSYRKLVELVC